MPPMSWTSKWRMPHRAPRRLAAHRERLGQDVVERLAALDALLELVGFRAERRRRRAPSATASSALIACDDRHHPLDVALVLGAEDLLQQRRRSCRLIIQGGFARPADPEARGRGRRAVSVIALARHHPRDLLRRAPRRSASSALTRVRPARTLLATRTWWAARAAIGARCVTHSTWRPSRGPGELLGDHRRHAPADARVDLVEDHRRHAVGARQDGLEGEHRPRQLAARRHARERTHVLARVRRQPELDAVEAPRPDVRRAAPGSTAISKRARSMPSCTQLALAPRRPAARRRRAGAPRACDGRLGELRVAARRAAAPARPGSPRGGRRRSSSAAASSRKASIVASVSPYFRLRRVSASRRSSIASSRPGATVDALAQRADRRERVLDQRAGAVDARRPGRRTPRRAVRDRAGRVPRGASRLVAEPSSSLRSPRGLGEARGQTARRAGAADAPRAAPPPPPAAGARRRAPTPGSAADPRAGPDRARPPARARPRPSPPGAWRRARPRGRAARRLRAKRSSSSSWRAGSSRRWCSCWPWISTRWSPSRSRSPTVTGRVVHEGAMATGAGELAPHHELALRPGRDPRRPAPPPPGRAAPRRRRASTVAVSVSVRMTSVWARAPRIEEDRVDEHRLAGAGLAGEHIEPGPEARR